MGRGERRGAFAPAPHESGRPRGARTRAAAARRPRRARESPSAELSGGEQQLVAIARALANEPRLLIADEPTAQLDSARAKTIMGLFRRLVDERGVSVVVATHDPPLIEMADHRIELGDGAVAADSKPAVDATGRTRAIAG